MLKHKLNKAIRKAGFKTNTEFAEKINTPYNTVRGWITRDKVPPIVYVHLKLLTDNNVRATGGCHK